MRRLCLSGQWERICGLLKSTSWLIRVLEFSSFNFFERCVGNNSPLQHNSA